MGTVASGEWRVVSGEWRVESGEFASCGLRLFMIFQLEHTSLSTRVLPGTVAWRMKQSYNATFRCGVRVYSLFSLKISDRLGREYPKIEKIHSFLPERPNFRLRPVDVGTTLKPRD